MKVKKFTAHSMPEAMKNVRNELGNDAVILNSRIVFTGGLFGLFRKKNFEVIAAVDPNPKQEFHAVLKEKQKISSTPIFPKLASEKEQKQQISAAPLTNAKQTDNLLKEISHLKELIQSQAAQSNEINGVYPEPVQKLVKWMNEQELSSALRGKLAKQLTEKWFTSGMKSSVEEMMAFLKDEITQLLIDKPYGGITFTKKFVNVIGPTGVGKTTTLAKIAAECILNHHKKVAFITTDTYRIAAIDQLKTYAQILNIPIEVCYNVDDFKAAALKFASYDVVLIDTAGRNFRNKKYVEELGKVIDFSMELETYLVLALTAKQKDMEEIYRQFSSVQIHQFIFTKADETSIYGSMINMVEKFNMGVAYITTGQNVPDDCLTASPKVLANLLCEEK